MKETTDKNITVTFTLLPYRTVKASVHACRHIPIVDVYLCRVDKDWQEQHPDMPRYITTLGLSDPVTGEFAELDFKRFKSYKEMKQYIIDFIEALNQKYADIPLTSTPT